MTLYEIDQALMDCIDMETGEILDTAAFDSLQMERNSKISGVACWYKNLMAEAAALDAEAESLTKRKKSCEAQATRLKEYLKTALNGQKFENERCKVTFRKTPESVKFKDDDEKAFVAWAKERRPDLLTYAEPKANKTAIKEAINSGLEFSLTYLESGTSITIK